MEKQFIPYELALKLKELGFDEDKCLYFYHYNREGLFSLDDVERNINWNDVFGAPLWQQAFDWLFNNFSYICIIENNMNYEQKQEKLKEAIGHIQDNKSK